MWVLKKLLVNSFTKTLFFVMIIVVITYFTVTKGSPQLLSMLGNWRSKEFRTVLIVGIPTLMLIPIYLNAFVFMKIVQIADNTKETNKLLKKIIKQLENKS